ncbi:MAG TPA: hypothetical protein VIE89_24890 [Candidatus Binatia bacterium]
MALANCEENDSVKAKQLWLDYQRQHDLSDRIGRRRALILAAGHLVWCVGSRHSLPKSCRGIAFPTVLRTGRFRSLFAQGILLVIPGVVSVQGLPTIILPIAGRDWPATIDTGFNGDLELPDALREPLKAQSVGRATAALAGGQSVEEDLYLVDFPFDGRIVQAKRHLFLEAVSSSGLAS